MAVDSAAKRFSMMGLDLPFYVALPPPSGTVSADERQGFLRKYTGILFAAAAVAINLFEITLYAMQTSATRLMATQTAGRTVYAAQVASKTLRST